jgi:hypothetical protein
MRINYVIASWAGKKGSICRDKLVNVYPHPETYLREHLNHLTKVNHNLSQITIMKALPTITEEVYNDYYNVSDLISKFSCPVEIVECPNFALSYGQYLLAYLKYTNTFDYYIFIEDDYVANCDDFDKILVELYRNKFPVDNVGYLCSWALKTKNIKFHAALSNGMLSSKSMEKLCKYYTNPFNQFKGLTHGDVQVKFSDMILESGVSIQDFTLEYTTPYYKGVHKTLIDCSKSPKNKLAIFIPLQMTNKLDTLTSLPKHRLAT